MSVAVPRTRVRHMPRRPLIAVFVAAALGLLGARYVGPAGVGLVVLGAGLVAAIGGWCLLRLHAGQRKRQTSGRALHISGNYIAPGSTGIARLWSWGSVLLVVAGAYWFWLASLDAHQRELQARFPAGERVYVIAKGKVSSAPVPMPDRSRPVRLDTEPGPPPALRAPIGMLAFEQTSPRQFRPQSVFELTVHEYHGDSVPLVLVEHGGRERIRVFTDEPWPDLRHGQTLTLPLQVTTPRKPYNPGEFDYQEYLRQIGISRQALWRFDHGADILAEPTPGHLFTPEGFTAEVRRETILFVHDQIGGTHSSLLLTLTLGIRSLLVPDLRDNFAKTGTVHLLVISGLHVGILAMLLEGLMLLLRIPMRSRAILMIGLLFLFCELTGGQVAVTRAVVMACVYYAARLTLRKADLLNVLAAAALVVVTLNPHELFHTGFHLSFLAVFWLALLANRWERRDEQRAEPVATQSASSALGLWALRFGWRAGVASAVVLVGLAPLLANNFALLSPSSLLVNVVALPVMTLILATAIPLLLGIGFEVLVGLPGLFAVPLGFMLYVAAAGQTMLLQTVFLIARQEWSHVVVPPPHWAWILPYQAVLLGAAIRTRLGLTWRRWLIAAALLILAGLWHALPTQVAASIDEIVAEHADRIPPNQPQLTRQPVESESAPARATLLHVGVGRCVVLHSPRGGTVVVDPGNTAAWALTRQVIAPYLWSQGTRQIDAIVLTEASHEVTRGLAELVRTFPVRRVIVSRALLESLDSEELLDPPRDAGATIVGVAPGDVVEFDGTRLWVLGPRAGVATTQLPLAVPPEPIDFGIEDHDTINALTGPISSMPILWEVPTWEGRGVGAPTPGATGRLLLPGRSDTFELDAIWQHLDSLGVQSVDAVVLPVVQPQGPFLTAWLERLNPDVVLHGHVVPPDLPAKGTGGSASRMLTTGVHGAITVTWPFHGKLVVRTHGVRR